MKLAIVGFPDLDADDRHWIESFRAVHDPQAARLSVHFTLVFPLEARLEDLEAEAVAVADVTAPIDFEIQRADVVVDRLGQGSHIFLVPDEGAANIVALHERLYSGVLKPQRRNDVPYLPHLTVGLAADTLGALELAASLDIGARLVRGQLGALDIVDVSAPRVRSVGTYPLRREPA
jgi:2'-5' RNA ligase